MARLIMDLAGTIGSFRFTWGKSGDAPLLEIELYDPIPEPVDPLNAQSTINPPVERVEIRLVHVNKPLQSLLYSVKMAYEAMVLLPEKDLKRLKIMNVLNETMDETTRFLRHSNLQMKHGFVPWRKG